VTHGPILLIGDDEGIRDAIADCLGDAGYGVVVAGNGLERMEALGRIAKPCLVLLDRMVPVMDGWNHRQLLLQP